MCSIFLIKHQRKKTQLKFMYCQNKTTIFPSVI